MPFRKIYLLTLLACSPEMVRGQVTFCGRTLDAGTNERIADVYIRLGSGGGIRAVSARNGTFKITLAADRSKDTLLFSLLGYDDARFLLSKWNVGDTVDVLLSRNVTMLNAAEVSSRSLRERKYGIRKRGFPLHITDGIFEWGRPFEIAQVIGLGKDPRRITSTNLYIADGKGDSATFLVNFYRYTNRQPGRRIFKNDIKFRRALRKGWLKLDLTPYRIYLGDSVMAAVRFVPEASPGSPFNYEIKLGGTSRSYYRRTENDSWHTPPHHYCMFVGALTGNGTPEEPEDEGSVPAFGLYSRHVKDSFSIFVHSPGYAANDPKKTYPLILVLDANAYFDQCKQLLSDRKMEDKVMLVGIGYGNAYLMDSLRVRDYTFPRSPEKDMPNTGGAKAFLDFIRTELLPYLNTRYAIDTNDITLMGHSFGGYFVLYALLDDLKQVNGHTTFSRYVAASPSVHYAHGYILKAFGRDMGTMDSIKGKKILVTMGEKETTGHHRLHRLMEALNEKGADARYEMLPRLEHMETPVPTFEKAVNTF